MVFSKIKAMSFLACLMALSACGGSDSEPPVEPPVVEATLRSITLSTEQTDFYFGDSISPSVSASWSDNTSTQVAFNSVSWSAVPTDGITVSSSNLQLNALGNIELTATYKDKSSILNITVADKVSEFTVSGPTNAYVNDLLDFTSTINYLSGSVVNVTTQADWSSSNDNIVSITSDGKAVAHAIGSAIISVQYGELTKQITVDISDPLLSIAIDQSDSELIVGDTLQLSLQGEYTSGIYPISEGIDWSSSDSDIAVVSTDGLITAVSKGMVTIHGMFEQQVASINITVQPPSISVSLSSISLSTAQTDFYFGDHVTPTVTASWSDGTSTAVAFNSVSWSAIPTDGITVLSSSLQLNRLDNIELTATYLDKTSTLHVNVADKATELTLSGPVDAYVNATLDFAASVNYLSGATANVTSQADWSSSNDSIASIRSNGQAKAHSVGSATIKVQFGELAEQLTLDISDPLLSISINQNDSELTAGETLALTLEGEYPSGNKDITEGIDWSSSNSDIAMISPDGLVSAVSKGMVTIHAMFKQQNASINLTILPASITDTQPEIVNGMVQLTEGEVLPDSLTINYSNGEQKVFDWMQWSYRLTGNTDESGLPILINSAQNNDKIRAIRAGDSSFVLSQVDAALQQALVDLYITDELTESPVINVTVTDNIGVYQWHRQAFHSISQQSSLVQTFQSGNEVYQVWQGTADNNVYLTTVGSHADAIVMATADEINRASVIHNQHYLGGGNGYYLLITKLPTGAMAYFRYTIATGDLTQIDMTGYQSTSFNLNFTSYQFAPLGDLFLAYSFNKTLTPYQYTFADNSWQQFDSKAGVYTQLPGLDNQIVALDTQYLTSTFREAQLHRFSLATASWEESQTLGYGNDDVYCIDKFSFVPTADNTLSTMLASCPLNDTTQHKSAGAYIWKNGLSQPPTLINNSPNSIVYISTAANWPIMAQLESGEVYSVFGLTELADSTRVVDVYATTGKEEISSVSERKLNLSYSGNFMVKQGDISTVTNPSKQQEMFSISDRSSAYHNEQEGWVSDLEMFELPINVDTLTPMFKADGKIYVITPTVIWTLQLRQ